MCNRLLAPSLSESSFSGLQGATACPLWLLLQPALQGPGGGLGVLCAHLLPPALWSRLPPVQRGGSPAALPKRQGALPQRCVRLPGPPASLLAGRSPPGVSGQRGVLLHGVAPLAQWRHRPTQWYSSEGAGDEGERGAGGGGGSGSGHGPGGSERTFQPPENEAALSGADGGRRGGAEGWEERGGCCGRLGQQQREERVQWG